MEAPRAWRRELDEVGERSGAALLGEPEQHEEDLGGRACVGQRTMARLGRDAEEVRQRGEPDPPCPLAEQAACEPDGVDDRCRDPPSGQSLDLAVEEGEVESRVVRDDRCVGGERHEAPHCELGSRRAP